MYVREDRLKLQRMRSMVEKWKSEHEFKKVFTPDDYKKSMKCLSVEIELHHVRPQVVVVGKSSGKSTLVNALLRQDLQRVSYGGCTSCVITIDDSQEGGHSFYKHSNGRSDLDLSNEDSRNAYQTLTDRNSANATRSRVKVFLDSIGKDGRRFLSHVTLTDTPPLDFLETSEDRTLPCAAKVIILVVDVTSGSCSKEIKYLANLAKERGNLSDIKLFVALNKCDKLDYLANDEARRRIDAMKKDMRESLKKQSINFRDVKFYDISAQEATKMPTAYAGSLSPLKEERCDQWRALDGNLQTYPYWFKSSDELNYEQQTVKVYRFTEQSKEYLNTAIHELQHRNRRLKEMEERQKGVTDNFEREMDDRERERYWDKFRRQKRIPWLIVIDSLKNVADEFLDFCIDEFYAEIKQMFERVKLEAGLDEKLIGFLAHLYQELEKEEWRGDGRLDSVARAEYKKTMARRDAWINDKIREHQGLGWWSWVFQGAVTGYRAANVPGAVVGAIGAAFTYTDAISAIFRAEYEAGAGDDGGAGLLGGSRVSEIGEFLEIGVAAGAAWAAAWSVKKAYRLWAEEKRHYRLINGIFEELKNMAADYVRWIVKTQRAIKQIMSDMDLRLSGGIRELETIANL